MGSGDRVESAWGQTESYVSTDGEHEERGRRLVHGAAG